MGAAKAKRRRIDARMDTLRGILIHICGRQIGPGNGDYERLLRRQAEMLSEEEIKGKDDIPSSE
jgi:hypothetical protein